MDYICILHDVFYNVHVYVLSIIKDKIVIKCDVFNNVFILVLIDIIMC